jgi:hypothetical protein
MSKVHAGSNMLLDIGMMLEDISHAQGYKGVPHAQHH